jgi:hypothetical protein
MAYALLLFAPLSLALGYVLDAPSSWVFLTSAAAITVLADWLRRATEPLAERAGGTIGGFGRHGGRHRADRDRGGTRLGRTRGDLGAAICSPLREQKNEPQC